MFIIDYGEVNKNMYVYRVGVFDSHLTTHQSNIDSRIRKVIE